MKRTIQTMAAILFLAGMANAEDLHPVSPVTSYTSVFKPQLAEAQKGLEAGVKSGNAREAIQTYTDSLAQMKARFVKARTDEYAKFRRVDLQARLDVEVPGVRQYKAREDKTVPAEYRSPAGMMFDGFDWNEISARGDRGTCGTPGITEGGKVVSVWVKARSEYSAERSWFQCQPKVTWKYENPEQKAGKDWDDLLKAIN